MTLPKHPATDLSSEQLERLMVVAMQAADAAADVTMAYFRKPLVVDNKSHTPVFDPVTEADKSAELAIRSVLLEAFPEIGFYGEEHATIESKSGLTWVVDPIDGTRAFMSGMPLWGTLIGLFDGEKSVLGVMDQPFLKERYLAYQGKSLLETSNQKVPLRCRTGYSLDQATFYCTTPDMFQNPKERTQFESIRDAVRLARYGGDCYAYALLASGYADVVIDGHLEPYDIEALIPLIENAGGFVTTWDGGSPVDGGFIAASASQALHEEVLATLASAS